MRRMLAIAAAIAVVAAVAGCSGKKEEDDTPKLSAPINNNAPEAQNAPAAPDGRGPDVPRPGGKRMTK
jgi:hypothetical protein